MLYCLTHRIRNSREYMYGFSAIFNKRKVNAELLSAAREEPNWYSEHRSHSLPRTGRTSEYLSRHEHYSLPRTGRTSEYLSRT